MIRYDHRDTGESVSYPPGEPDYTGDDLVADADGVLDALGVAGAFPRENWPLVLRELGAHTS